MFSQEKKALEPTQRSATLAAQRGQRSMWAEVRQLMSDAERAAFESAGGDGDQVAGPGAGAGGAGCVHRDLRSKRACTIGGVVLLFATPGCRGAIRQELATTGYVGHT